MYYFFDDLFLKHDTGFGHPENPGRLEAILDALQSQSWFSRLRMLSRRFARDEELLANHSSEHLKNLTRLSEHGGGAIDSDTILSADSWDAARLAAGAGLAAADAIAESRSDSRTALLLLRPPGHHARREQAMGFCFLNNVAIAAHYLKSKGLTKIAILDWDVHHGNGTEESFYADGDVLYISTHQYPCYPGTGRAEDTGAGAGVGANLNVPLAPYSTDEDYKKAFEEKVLPKLQEFKPEVLLISAGFDAHKKDPLAQIELSSGFFEWATARALATVEPFTKGRTISFLEGGYHHAALAESVLLHAAALLG